MKPIFSQNKFCTIEFDEVLLWQKDYANSVIYADKF
jgi:hypothetical protein